MCFARRIHFCCWRRQAPRILVQAEILDVDIAPEAGVEEQVPAGVMIVVVDIDAVAFPFPIAAAVEVVVGNHPIRIIVEDHAASPVIDSARDIYFSYVLVAAVWISPTRLKAVVFGIPVRMGVVRIVPALVVSVVMAVPAVAAIFVLVLALVLPVVVAVAMVATVLRRSGDGQRSGQSHEKYA